MSEKILEIEKLTVSFDGFKALNDLNFSMDKGELRVIIGPNGAGKTTFLDVITGKVQPTEGRVLFHGRNLRHIPEHKIARLGIGRKFQTPRVYQNLTVRENLDLVSNRNKSVFSTLFGQASTAERRSVAGLLETIGLIGSSELPAKLLSHGEKQRLEIGMLVAQSPDLLLVDEPVAGLTDEETENVGNLLLNLAESHSIIVIEHDMEFVRQIARKVTVLHQGSVLCEGNMDQVQNDPQVIEVYLGQQPSISPSQLKLLRVIATLAYSDGYLTSEEMGGIIGRLSRVFSENAEEQEQLQQELKAYILTDVDVEELLSEITSNEERESILRLSYQVIASSSRYSDNIKISEKEVMAYQKLIEKLDLSKEVIQELESEIELGVR